MTDSTSDALTTDELREKAFELAKRRRDVGFFWDVLRHLPHAPEAEEVDGSLGSVGAAIDSALELWHELNGREGHYGEAEPLLRAKFIDYLNPASATEEVA
ncbi:MAG TPA: hypothetical protein VE172_18420 [Stackebrandtia sp.]|jgi:hypothetical protein|uniref:hypothetical protein n=1 Tax=Stackebrandtia sp. TaxID=2023065 RepID=UPI002D2E6E96|nr:hypothetical protein [Stackebrandtia sp.]HZE40781.1 hypothetical protein [Stackebrandtia sp.]